MGAEYGAEEGDGCCVLVCWPLGRGRGRGGRGQGGSGGWGIRMRNWANVMI